MEKFDAVNSKYPNQAGVWRRADGDLVDIYPLEPVGGTLCAWGADVGITFTVPQMARTYGQPMSGRSHTR